MIMMGFDCEFVWVTRYRENGSMHVQSKQWGGGAYSSVHENIFGT